MMARKRVFKFKKGELVRRVDTPNKYEKQRWEDKFPLGVGFVGKRSQVYTPDKQIRVDFLDRWEWFFEEELESAEQNDR